MVLSPFIHSMLSYVVKSVWPCLQGFMGLGSLRCLLGVGVIASLGKMWSWVQLVLQSLRTWELLTHSGKTCLGLYYTALLQLFEGCREETSNHMGHEVVMLIINVAMMLCLLHLLCGEGLWIYIEVAI